MSHIWQSLTVCSGRNAPAPEKHRPYSTPLSLEQSKCWHPDLQISTLVTQTLHSLFIIYVLILNTGRVFVTYEADNDKHVNEIINFVALLRHNGFDTHVRTCFMFSLNYVFFFWVNFLTWCFYWFQIDIFEQQFRSISKIDFMERYLSEVKKKKIDFSVQLLILLNTNCEGFK